jgi:glycolate oxidase FAD binding subunit
VCGSLGRLALIARASFRLHPLPKAARTLVVETDDAARVVALLLRSQLQPSALDVLHPGRVAVLFEGSERAVEAQLESARVLVGGEHAGAEIWEEARTRHAEACGRVRFAPGELRRVLADVPEAVVRASAGVAYTRDPTSSGDTAGTLGNLLERIQRELDPRGVFAA